MDLVVLRRLIAELEPRLVGQRVDQVYALPRHDLAIVTSARASGRLWFSADPTDPHLYLRSGGHDSPDRPPAFAMAARKWARGQRIVRLRVVGADRVVALELVNGAALFFAFVPRRSMAVVVDPNNVVAAVWNPRRGRPGPGDPWTPPERRQRADPGTFSDSDWQRLAELPDDRALVTTLVREIDGMSHLVAREVAARRPESIPMMTLVLDELRRAERSATDCRIYSPAPLAELTEDPGPTRLLLAPYPLGQAIGLAEYPCRDLVEGAALLFGTRSRLRRVAATRQAVTSTARGRLRVISRTRNKMQQRRSEPGDAERLRRLGDVLLASPGAEIADDEALVTDIHGDGAPMRVPVDPSRTLVQNAQDHYRLARRAERRVKHQIERLRLLDEEEAELHALLSAADDLGDEADCDRIVAASRRSGLELRVDRLRTPEASRSSGSPAGDRRDAGRQARDAEPGPGIRRFRTSAGSDLLIGRSAKGNDRLSHRVAAREDWWLHAGGPGAHVVLRNPLRVATPPTEELEIAASLAAWFSKSRGATKCEVHWTQASQVKRPRRGAPGLVILRQHQSLLVEPRSPEDLGVDEIS